MKVFQIERPGVGAYRDIPLRELLPDEALVKVAYSGICGTDISFFTGDTNLVRSGQAQYPIRIGHEWSGVVERTGAEVSRFAPGDRVVGDSGVACGRCGACRNGDYAGCGDIRSVGTINCWDGSFAEYIIMPERHLFHLPEGISLECGSLIEPATIAYNGLIKSDIRDKNVAVIGTGPIGMTGLSLACHMGAENVIMIGRTASKLEVAKRLGATHTVNSVEEDAAGRMAELTGGKGADLVLEASGALSSIRTACGIAAHGGLISLLAFYEKNLDDLDIDAFVMKELRMAGVMGAFGLPAPVIDLIVKNGIDLSPVITHRITFDEVPETFHNCMNMKDRIKIVVKM